ncbi:hypothetical protein C8R44DRAFT_865153 [Mycena epipterygia]|nr:hypothetical protein C8R44DRAFT_865153 [Mycena epipterygia]
MIPPIYGFANYAAEEFDRTLSALPTMHPAMIIELETGPPTIDNWEDYFPRLSARNMFRRVDSTPNWSRSLFPSLQ